MITDVHIRDEQPRDIDSIFALTKAAFVPMPFSNGSEPYIINALRDDGDLTISLVIEKGGEIIGQITFSPVKIKGVDAWYGLGPVSIAPDCQKKGIGKALINEGIARLKTKGANGCVLGRSDNLTFRIPN